MIAPHAIVRATPATDIDNLVKFVASSEGLALAKAFRRIEDAELPRSVVRMAETVAERS
jgi:hypothetical protein